MSITDVIIRGESQNILGWINRYASQGGLFWSDEYTTRLAWLRRLKEQEGDPVRKETIAGIERDLRAIYKLTMAPGSVTSDDVLVKRISTELRAIAQRLGALADR